MCGPKPLVNFISPQTKIRSDKLSSRNFDCHYFKKEILCLRDEFLLCGGKECLIVSRLLIDQKSCFDVTTRQMEHFTPQDVSAGQEKGVGLSMRSTAIHREGSASPWLVFLP